MTDGTIPLSEIQLWEDNPKLHDVPGLARDIRRYGFNVDLGIRDGKLFAGHGRREALALIKLEGPKPDLDKQYPPVRILVREDGEWLVPYSSLDHLTEDEAHHYAVQDNLLNQRGKFERQKLKDLFNRKIVESDQTDFTPKQKRLIMASGKKREKVKVSFQSFVDDIPDAAFPAEPTWNIPMLNADLQADVVDRPFIKWGELGRTEKHHGTVHFYTDDYKFSALDKNPLKLVDTECVTAVEPNFTTHIQMPKFEVLHRVGRKRWMARLWQEHGLRILVDLFVEKRFRDLNLLGVPRDWGAFCTRAYAGQEDTLRDTFLYIKDYTGQKPHLFVVYGGGIGIEHFCAEQQWVWFPDHQTIARA